MAFATDRERADEIRRFENELRTLYERLDGQAHLQSLEGWVDLTIAGNGSGRLEVTGRVCDAPGSGNVLSFSISDYDQTFLPPLLGELAQVGSAFPVVGDINRPTRPWLGS